MTIDHCECIDGDCENGIGTVRWATGDVYVGSWKDGKQHGNGTYWSVHDEETIIVYIGEFRDGLKCGHGTNITRESIYIGDFEHDIHNGQGIMRWSNGGEYRGGFKNGERHGQGIMRYSDGKVEVQQWNNGSLKGYRPQESTGQNKRMESNG